MDAAWYEVRSLLAWATDESHFAIVALIVAGAASVLLMRMGRPG